MDEVLVDGKLPRKIRQRSAERKKLGKCLNDDNKIYQRGVCTTCHGRFITEKNKYKTDEERAAYDLRQVMKGVIGPDRRGQKDYENPFREDDD